MNGETRQAELTVREIEAMYDRMKTAGSKDVPQGAGVKPENSEAAAEPLVDNYNFPFEPEGIYNSALLDFEEIAGALWVVINHTHYCASRYNRMSPNYTLLMQHLEKDIRQMGSYCITKVVLEQSGREFPGLEMMDLKELCCMVSLHFRKCCRAYNDIFRETSAQDLNMMGWIFRWAGLFERLKATQDKIDRIKSGKIKIESLLETQNVYKDEPKMRRDRSGKMVDPQMKVSSMPVMRSYTKEVKQWKKAEEKQERAKLRDAERAKRRLEREIDRKTDYYKPAFYPPLPLPKMPGIGMNEKELRKLLMDEAISRMNMAEAGIIAREPLEKLVERFKKRSGQQPGTLKSSAVSVQSSSRDPIAKNRSGPSDETRKKLREKRKKRK